LWCVASRNDGDRADAGVRGLKFHAAVRGWFGAIALVLVLSAARMGGAQDRANDDWPTYGGGLAAQHYSARTQITRENVGELQPVWTFHTGALAIPGQTTGQASFEANPVLWDGRLYFDTPYDTVFAIDATSGKEVWRLDPQVSHDTQFGIVTSRGVALWHGARGGREVCGRDRVFVATLDRRLIAMDAGSGAVCANFGRGGVVDLAESLHLKDTRFYTFTSPPTVVRDVVIVGSSVGDNQLVEAASGVIRGFDARSGRLLWSFEPLPWAQRAKQRSGSGGVWSVIAADPKLGLVYLPTGSPSLDFWGVNRPGANRDADSVVALNAKTGRRVWGFQVVHHDLWDLDVAAEPMLFTFRNKIPAVAISTKMGMTFVLDRRTGRPLYPVEERPVPRSSVPGEEASPTQPFSTLPLMAPMTIDPSEFRGVSEQDTRFCREKIAGLVNEGVYTPVGLKPTLLYPGSAGGVNWGSAALDPKGGVLFANVNRLAYVTQLVPRESVEPVRVSTPAPRRSWIHRLALRARLRRIMTWWRARRGVRPTEHETVKRLRFLPPDAGGAELSANAGSPYRLRREPILTPGGLPCTPGPWGAVVALDLNRGVKLWTSPLGTLVPGQATGAVTVSARW